MKLMLLAALAATMLSHQAATSAGDIAFRSGDFDRAFAAYEAEAAASPGDRNALVGLGTMYLYRNQISDAKKYLTLAVRAHRHDDLAKRRLAALVRQEGAPGDFRITMDEARTVVPFVQTDPLPMIEAKVNGQPVRLLIDTGAAALELSPDAAKRCGIAMRAAGTAVFAGGMKARIRRGHADRLTLASTIIRNVPAGELPAGASMLGGATFDGIIGTTILRRFIATLDYRHARLVLEKRSASAAVEARAHASGAAVVSMWLVPDHFIFAQARVNDRFKALFSIDTGGAGVGIGLTKAALAAANVTPDASKAFEAQGGGGSMLLEPFAANVSLGSFTEKNVPGVFSPAGDPYAGFPFTVSGAISHEFFRHATLTFDFEAMKLIVI
ncbi:MAG TPA: retropepsin-like aspartic protease [Candidatus Aquilonibacter sp.]|nr:retropepsin-like aspartic protease [Candidatus Aquilonibacter sp.]